MHPAQRSTPAAAEAPLADLPDTFARIGHAAVRYGEGMTALHNRAVTLFLDEAARRHRYLLQATTDYPFLARWPLLAWRHACRDAEILLDGWQALLRLEDALLAPMPARQATHRAQPATTDRRRQSVVISFPDRRLAA